MAASEAFRGSPQLIAFLRYVIEATLRGEQDRIKGYTIAVEALGRTDDFDPQSDPIVRVEATRLRRAINRYYDNGGKHDPVQIDLPLGSYVPSFRRVAPTVVPLPTAPSAAPPPLCRMALRRLAQSRGRRRADRFRREPLRRPRPRIRLQHAKSASMPRCSSPRPHARRQVAPRGPAYPVVFVGAFQSPAEGAAAMPPSNALREKTARCARPIRCHSCVGRRAAVARALSANRERRV